MMIRLNYFATIISIVLMCVLAEEIYSDKYDDIDVRNILENDKLRMQYINCFLEKGPCKTPDAKFFKEIFAEIIMTKCKKCTEKQKEMLDVAVDWFAKNKPEEWQILVEKAIENLKKKNANQ